MLINRKQCLIEFLKGVSEENLVGLYYLNKDLNILHYRVFQYEEIPDLIDKIFKYSIDLESDLVHILDWKASSSEDDLRDIYDDLESKLKGGEIL